MGAWIVLLAYCGFGILFGYKNEKWNYFNIIILMSLCLGYVSSYVSGHTFDELTTTLFIGLIMGALMKNLRETNNA